MELIQWTNGKGQTIFLTEIEAIDLKQRLAKMLDTGLYHDDTSDKLEVKIERR